jgi:hypothetical protein
MNPSVRVAFINLSLLPTVYHGLHERRRDAATGHFPFGMAGKAEVHKSVPCWRSRRLLLLGHSRDRSLRLYVVAPPLSDDGCLLAKPPTGDWKPSQ